jgi:hypothetical protein
MSNHERRDLWRCIVYPRMDKQLAVAKFINLRPDALIFSIKIVMPFVMFIPYNHRNLLISQMLIDYYSINQNVLLTLYFLFSLVFAKGVFR